MKEFIRNHIISMEFRNDLIRVVTGKVKNNCLLIKKIFSIELPSEVYENGTIIDFQQLSYIIRRQLEINKIRTKNTHILLDSDRIIIREIVLPLIREENYNEFLQYHIDDYIPIKKEDYIIRYIIVDSLLNNESTRLQVVATPRNLVEEFHRLIKNLNLKPVVFDVVPNCIAKFLAYKEEFGSVVAIGIDFYQTNVVICDQGQLRYSKQLDIGYKKLLEDLNELDIDKYDLMGRLSDLDFDCESEANRKVGLANKNFQEILLKEIELIFNYYLEGTDIEKIYLYEDYSKTNNIEEIFSDYFRCRCEKITVLDDKNCNDDLLYYANCIGGIIRL